MTTITGGLRPAEPGEKSVSLIQVAISRVGIRKGAKVAAFATSWAIAEGSLGHELGEGRGIEAALAEYGSWWKQSRATTWRELQAWRMAFPEEESPARLVRLAQEHQANRRQTAAGGIGALALAV